MSGDGDPMSKKCLKLQKKKEKNNFFGGKGVVDVGSREENHVLSIFEVKLEHFSYFFYFFGITIKNATKWLLQFF